MTKLQAIRAAAPDLMLVCGAGCLAYGAWLVFPAAGFVVAGLLLLYGGIKLARAE